MTVGRPVVSIIMPVFNGELYLRSAIASVQEQSWRAWELILVDDGSTDSTAEIVASIADPRIRYAYQDNSGQASALNRGLALAGGEFITTLDADDWYPVNSLLIRVERLLQCPDQGVVYGDGMYVGPNGHVMGRFSEHMPAGAEGDVFDTLLISPFYGTGAAVMVRRSVLIEHGVRYDESLVWCQDWDFYLRLAAKTPFSYVDAITINYRVHDSSMTMTMPEGRRLESLIRMRRNACLSGRFAATAEVARFAFLEDLVVRNMHGAPGAQLEFLASDAVDAIPAGRQAQLLRHIGVSYLVDGPQVDWVRRFLARAAAKTPLNSKTLAALALSCVSPGVARRVAGRWRARCHRAGPQNPFNKALDPR